MEGSALVFTSFFAADVAKSFKTHVFVPAASPYLNAIDSSHV